MVNTQPVNVIVCPNCKSVLATTSANRLCVGGIVAIYKRIMLTCLKCHAQVLWRPSDAK